MKNIYLGYRYRDKITSFVGTATSHVQFITGCDQLHLQPDTKDGAFVEGHYFDINRLEKINHTPLELEESVEVSKKGADTKLPKKK